MRGAETAADWVGALASRELLLVGAVLYMCEGTKSKPANPRYDLTFTNSDIRLVELFVRFVETTGRSRHGLRYRVAIHEDVEETPSPDHADRRRGGVPDVSS